MIEAYIFLTIWVFLSSVFNFFSKNKRLIKLKRKFTILQFLFPTWRVFSPEPINSDLKIYYRDLLKNGSTTDLNEVKFYSSKSSPICDIYYKETKFLYSLYQSLSNYSKKRTIHKSIIYLSLKDHIKKIDSRDEISSRQICIVREFGFHNNSKRVVELIDYIDFD